jgi:hypothetical protein
MDSVMRQPSRYEKPKIEKQELIKTAKENTFVNNAHPVILVGNT